MLGFLPTRAYRPGTPGATTFLSPLSGTFNYGWDSIRNAYVATVRRRDVLGLLLMSAVALSACGREPPHSIVPIPRSFVTGEGVFVLDAASAIGLSDPSDAEGSGARGALGRSGPGRHGPSRCPSPPTVRCASVSMEVGVRRATDSRCPSRASRSLRVITRASSTACKRCRSSCPQGWKTGPGWSRRRSRFPPYGSTTPPVSRTAVLHLDVARHFFGPDFVKRYIDMLARYKINRFHWHLTEDQGWRIQIDRYPRLTQVGAYRAQTHVGHGREDFNGDGQRYGGFYTKDEIRRHRGVRGKHAT